MAVAALIPAAIGAYGIISGAISKGKANKRAKQLAATRPKEQDSPYAKDALSLAESELSTGMSGKAKQAMEEGEDKDYSNALGAILKGGGSVNNIGSLFSEKAGGRQKMALLQENLRLNQISNLQRAQQINEDNQKQEFEFNQWMPWADESQANAQAKADSSKEINSGINTLGSAASSYFGGKEGQKQTDEALKFNKPSADDHPSEWYGRDNMGAGPENPNQSYDWNNDPSNLPT